MLYIIIVQLFIISPVLSMDKVTKDLLTPLLDLEEYCGYMSCPKEVEGLVNVHIVPATHEELGYTKTFYEHFTGHDEFYSTTTFNMKNILDAVITSLWTHSRRKFTITDMPYLFHWWKSRDGTVRRMVYELVRQGRLFFAGGGWGMSDEGTTSYHAIIDHFTYSLRKLNATFLECGRPLVTWQSDAYGHSREFASLMAQMGFDGHFIHPISFEDEITRMKTKSLEFMWRGSDDLGPASDIFTHKLYDGFWSPPGFCFGSFCEDPLIVTSDDTFSNAEERAKQFFKIAMERQSPYYTTNHIMIVMGSRSAYSDAELWFANIDKLIAQVNMRANEFNQNLVLYYSTPICYLQAVNKHQPKLKTKQDDFFPYSVDKYTHTAGMYTSRPVAKLLARQIHLFSQMAKQLQIIGKLGNNDRKYEDIMWIAGAMQDHMIITGASQTRVILDYARKVELAKDLCLDMYRNAFNKLRNSPKQLIYYNCQFNVSSCWNIETEAFFVVVYNPLGWPVTRSVRLPVFRKPYNVYDPKGNKLNHSIVSIQDIVKPLVERGEVDTSDELVFLAEKLPPLGYRSYYIEQIKYEDLRFKRAIIKFSKNKKRKFLTRQNNNLNIDDDSLLDDIPAYDYLDDMDNETTTEHTKILFGNVTKVKQKDSYKDYVLTPPPKKKFEAEINELGLGDSMYYNLTKSSSTSSTTSKVPTNHLTPTTDTKKHSIQVTRTEKKTRGQHNTATQITRTNNLNSTPITYTEIKHTDKFSTDPLNTLGDKSNTTHKTSTETVLSLDDKLSILTNKNSSLTDTPISPPDTRSTLKEKNTPTKIKTTAEEDYNYYDESTPVPIKEQYHRRLMENGYFSRETNDNFIKNEYIKIQLGQKRQNIARVDLSNGVSMALNIQMCYYVSDNPLFMGKERKEPGPHVFRPVDAAPVLIAKKIVTKVLKTEIVEEIHFQYTDWAALAVRLYKTLPTIEIDWTVGPIPIADTFGKDVFIRYATDLVNKGVFYTDSNGRQMMKRIRNSRPTYMILSEDYIAGNFYPVTSKIYIEDTSKNIRFSIFTDRAEGATSLDDGLVDLMLHRRILTTDPHLNVTLNEVEYKQGQIVRGTHYLYLSKADYRPNKIFEKKFAKELELKPHVFTSNHPDQFRYNYTTWINKNNEYSALRMKLPIGVHILTLEKWHKNYLLRLENYLEKSDVVHNGVKTVFIKDLFRQFRIIDAKETTLGANLRMEDYFPLPWQKEKFMYNFNDAYGGINVTFAEEIPWQPNYEKIDLNKGIQLFPQQIRTFVITYVNV